MGGQALNGPVCLPRLHCGCCGTGTSVAPGLVDPLMVCWIERKAGGGKALERAEESRGARHRRRAKFMFFSHLELP